MGQLVTYLEKPSAKPGFVRFETNRCLTGMGHLRYTSRDQAVGYRPPDELARRLFDRGGIDGVHMYSNVVTVELSRGATTEGIGDIITGLYTYWQPGMEPPTFDEETPDE